MAFLVTIPYVPAQNNILLILTGAVSGMICVFFLYWILVAFEHRKQQVPKLDFKRLVFFSPCSQYIPRKGDFVLTCKHGEDMIRIARVDYLPGENVGAIPRDWEGSIVPFDMIAITFLHDNSISAWYPQNIIATGVVCE